MAVEKTDDRLEKDDNLSLPDLIKLTIKRRIVNKPTDEQPNAGVHKSIVVGAFVEFGFTATLLSYQNEQFDQQVDGQKSDVRPPNDRIAKQIDPIVVAGEELAL